MRLFKSDFSSKWRIAGTNVFVSPHSGHTFLQYGDEVSEYYSLPSLSLLLRDYTKEAIAGDPTAKDSFLRILNNKEKKVNKALRTFSDAFKAVKNEL